MPPLGLFVALIPFLMLFVIYFLRYKYYSNKSKLVEEALENNGYYEIQIHLQSYGYTGAFFQIICKDNYGSQRKLYCSVGIRDELQWYLRPTLGPFDTIPTESIEEMEDTNNETYAKNIGIFANKSEEELTEKYIELINLDNQYHQNDDEK